MIVRPISGHHICLRCQLSLARHYIRHKSRPLHSTVRQYRDEASNASQPWNDSKVGGSRPLWHGHRGRQKRESFEKLHHKTSLGDPTKVLLLKDSPFTLYDARRKQFDAQQPQHIDILEQLADERGLVGQKEVEENIDALKPTIDIEDREDINTLVDVIGNGFGQKQLEQYIEHFKAKNQHFETKAPRKEWVTKNGGHSIVRITPWLPGISEIEDRFDNDPLRGYCLGSHTAKQRLVIQILKECWGLELPEVVEGIGQFEVELEPKDLEFLLTGRESLLDNLHSTYVQDRNERLEAFRSRAVIRVTTTLKKKQFIIRGIKQALSSVKRRDVNLKDFQPQGTKSVKFRWLERWVNKKLDEPALDELGRLTQTDLVMGSRNLITMSATQEKRLDIASRLILATLYESEREKYQLASNAPGLINGSFVEYFLLEGLPWRERLRTWLRWVAPIPKPGEPNMEPILRPLASGISQESDPDGVPRDMTEIKDKTLLPSFKPRDQPSEPRLQPKPTDSSNWAKEPAKTPAKGKLKTSTSSSRPVWKPENEERFALLGSVLHSSVSPTKDIAGTSSSRDAIGQHNAIQAFCTKIPNLSRILGEAKLVSHLAKDIFVLRLLPSPFGKVVKKSGSKDARRNPAPSNKVTKHIGYAAFNDFPAIELNFSINSTQGVSRHTLQRVSAVLEEQTTDIMLPQYAVDVRFKRRTTSELSPNVVGSSKGIRQFLENSELDLKKDLNIAHTMMLPIEDHLCLNKGLKLLSNLEKDSKKDLFLGEVKKEYGGETETRREVEYMYVGLEFRSTLVFEYNGWTLDYTNIEGGKAGGRRGELKLRPLRNGQPVSDKEFSDMAYELAGIFSGGSVDQRTTIPGTVRRVALSEDMDRGIVRTVVSRTGGSARETFDYFHPDGKASDYSKRRLSARKAESKGRALSASLDKAGFHGSIVQSKDEETTDAQEVIETQLIDASDERGDTNHESKEQSSAEQNAEKKTE